MKRHTTLFGTALGIAALTLVLGCDDPTGPGYPVTPPGEINNTRSRLVLSPPSAEIGLYQVVRFTVTLKGEQLKASEVEWRSSDPGRAQIVGDGEVLGVARGSFVITATHPAATGQAYLRVGPRSKGNDEGKELPDQDDRKNEQ